MLLSLVRPPCSFRFLVKLSVDMLLSHRYAQRVANGLLLCAAQVKLFIETFTEQFATFGLLRASTRAQLKEREDKFVAGLKVQHFSFTRAGAIGPTASRELRLFSDRFIGPRSLQMMTMRAGARGRLHCEQ